MTTIGSHLNMTTFWESKRLPFGSQNDYLLRVKQQLLPLWVNLTTFCESNSSYYPFESIWLPFVSQMTTICESNSSYYPFESIWLPFPMSKSLKVKWLPMSKNPKVATLQKPKNSNCYVIYFRGIVVSYYTIHTRIIIVHYYIQVLV